MVEAMEKDFIDTDLGKRPIEWLPQPISGIVYDFRGGAPFAPPDFTELGFLVLPKGGVLRGGNLLVEKGKQQYCSIEYAERHKSNIVDKGYTIVVLRDLVPSGPNIGLMVRINSNEKYIIAQGVYGFKVKSEKVFSDFLIHVSNTNEYRKVMRNIMVGSTQVHITNKTFLKVEIPLPPTKAEQTAIATALNDTDALINSLEKLIAKKRNIKQGAMQELLKPKDGWEVKKLGEIAEVKSGKRLPLGKILIDKVTPHPYIRIVDMHERGILLNEIKYVPDDVYPTIKNYRIFKDEIYISVAGTLGLVGRIPNVLDGANLTENANKLTAIKCSIDYLLFVLKSDIIQNKIKAEKTLGAQPKLALTRIRNFEVPLPKSEKQIHIAQILSHMDAEIEALEKKLEKYQMIKQGMMQNLLTGKVRLV